MTTICRWCNGTGDVDTWYGWTSCDDCDGHGFALGNKPTLRQINQMRYESEAQEEAADKWYSRFVAWAANPKHVAMAAAVWATVHGLEAGRDAAERWMGQARENILIVPIDPSDYDTREQYTASLESPVEYDTD